MTAMKKYGLVILLPTYLATLTACGSAPSQTASTPNLNNTSWTLSKIGTAAPIGKRPITLTFAQFRFSGHAGCNQYGGFFKTEKNKRIRIHRDKQTEKEQADRVFSTKMHCPFPKGLMDQEQEYLEQIRNSNSYKIVNTNLVIRTEDTTLTFKAN